MHGDDRDYDDDPYARGGERPRSAGGSASTSQKLSRLRDGLAREASRGGYRRDAQDVSGARPDLYADDARSLSDPIDRAIDRVGDVFADLEASPDGVRDPYAEPLERDARFDDGASYDRAGYAEDDRYASDHYAGDPYAEEPYAPDAYRDDRYAEAEPRARADDYGANATNRVATPRFEAESDAYDFEAYDDRVEGPADDYNRDPYPPVDPYDEVEEAPRQERAPRRAKGRAAARRRESGPNANGFLERAPRSEDEEADEGARSDRAARAQKPARKKGGWLLGRRDRKAQEDAPDEDVVARDGSSAPPEEMFREARRVRREEIAERAERAPTQRPEPPTAPEIGAPARGASPFGSLERLLAGRYLRARRKEGFISVIALLSLIGITLAVAVLIVVMSVMNGFRAELIDKIVGVNGHLIVTPIERGFEDYDAAAAAIRTVPGVTRAAPLIEGQAFATSARGGVGVMVRGLGKADLLNLKQVSVSPETSVGSLAAFGDGEGIAIGAGLARRLGVTVGDTISVISPQGSVTPFGVTPKRRAYEVIYVFKMGMSNYDDVLVFMPIDQAQTFFNRAGRADFIEVKVATPDRLDGYSEDIEAAAGLPLGVRSWRESNQVFIGALETEQSVMFLILSMLILIASLIIVSGLIMLVKEKGPDIAILRTMGLTRGGVMRVFFMCGATIGVVGATVGVALGVVVALNVNDIKVFIENLTGRVLFPEGVYLFSQLPSRLDWGDVGFTILITLGLSFLATLYPAWRAARMDPVEALRYE